MKVFYTHKAVKQIDSLHNSIQKRIFSKMRFYMEQKDPLKFAKRLTDYNDGEFCFRVGDYRLVFDVNKDTIYILKIDRRDKIYK